MSGLLRVGHLGWVLFGPKLELQPSDLPLYLGFVLCGSVIFNLSMNSCPKRSPGGSCCLADLGAA